MTGMACWPAMWPIAGLLFCALLPGEPMYPGKWPVPENARVKVVLDKDTYFLGENLLAHFYVENAGEEAFEINIGGDYRGASRSLRYVITANGEDGSAVADPDPSGFCMGGLSWSPKVEPGKPFCKSLPLMRYCRFEKPGTYTVRVKHDLGWKETDGRKTPVGEARLELAMPTAEQARRVLEEMEKLADDPNRVSGRRTRPYADFSTLRFPVYLPFLKARASRGSKKALAAIANMATPEATRALVGLLEHEDAAFALGAAQRLNYRLPDPQLEGKLGRRNPFHNDQETLRAWLSKRAWRPEFTPEVRSFARKSLARGETRAMVVGAFMLTALGQKEDFPALLTGLDTAVEATVNAVPEKGVYPRPRGACQELVRALDMFLARGVEAPRRPSSAGQAVVFLRVLGTKEDFRPAGWEKTVRDLLRHRIPYLREAALVNLPEPFPDYAVTEVQRLLSDIDADVRISACRVAQKLKSSELIVPLRRMIWDSGDSTLLNAASNALSVCGSRMTWMNAWVYRLSESGMGMTAIRYLSSAVVADNSGSGSSGNVDAKAWGTIKQRWQRFLKDNREAIQAGEKFKIGDPRLSPDLFPKGFRMRRKKQPDWP